MLQAFRRSETRYRFQMGLDQEAFLLALPAALAQPFQRQATPDAGLVLTGEDPDAPWALAIRALPPLRLGALSLPRLQVDLDLAGHPPEAAEAFARRFLAHFQRAGG